MPSAAARAKIPALTRDEALAIINRMPYFVCMCTQKLLNSQLKPLYSQGKFRPPTTLPEKYQIEFEVFEGQRSYRFPLQWFRVIRVITKAEFIAAAPWASVRVGTCVTFFYEIHTD